MDKLQSTFKHFYYSVEIWILKLNNIEMLRKYREDLDFNNSAYNDFAKNLISYNNSKELIVLPKDYKFVRYKKISQMEGSILENLTAEYKKIRPYRLDVLNNFNEIRKVISQANYKTVKNKLSSSRRSVDKLFKYVLNYFNSINEYEKSKDRISYSDLVTTELADIFLDLYSLYESSANEYCMNINSQIMKSMDGELNKLKDVNIKMIYDWLDSHTNKNGYYKIEIEKDVIQFRHQKLLRTKLFEGMLNQISDLRNFLVHGGKSVETNSFANFRYINDFIFILISEIWYIINHFNNPKVK